LDEKALKARALACLAQREHSRSELRRKLLTSARNHASRCGDADASGDEATARIDTVLDWLEANSYLSQQRFVESRVRVRGERFGTHRIRLELAQHGLTLPAETGSALLSSEFSRAFAIWARRFGRDPAAEDHSDHHATAEHQAKQARFLAGRGFSGDVIRRVLRAGVTRADTEKSNSDADESVARDTRATLPR
jgi:regulatory protein